MLLFLLVFAGITYGQSVSTKDVVNSTDVVLDSAGIFLPTSWRNATGYNSITLSILSNQSSASSGVKIYWADKGVTTGAYRTMDSVTTTYTTGTIFKLTLPIIAPYFKVKYTNTTTAQTTFSLVTLLHIGQQLTLDDNGYLKTNVILSALPSGAATAANQTTQIAEADSTVDMVTLMNTSLDNIEADADSIVDEITKSAVSLALLDNAVDGNYLNVNNNIAGADVSANTGNADATTQRVVLATDQPTISVTLSPTDTVTVKGIVDALPTGNNNIGNVDIVSLPAGNLGQQLSSASLSVTPATDITDATYIGDIKFGESLPSGTAIIGQVGIDQTTPGTTNKVYIGTDGTVTANAGTNLNTSALSLEATQVDVKANQTNGTQTSRSVSYSLPSYSTFTAGVAADTLSGTSVACIKVTIMNASAGKVLYYGFDGSVTTANGQGALGYLDTATIYVTNLNKVYLISDSATTDVRVTYYNY